MIVEVEPIRVAIKAAVCVILDVDVTVIPVGPVTEVTRISPSGNIFTEEFNPNRPTFKSIPAVVGIRPVDSNEIIPFSAVIFLANMFPKI